MRKAFLSLVLLVTCCTVTPADEPLHLEWKKLQSSAAVLDPTAAQDKTESALRVLEKKLLEHPNWRRVSRTYSLRDFSIWSEDGKKCDAAILVALIKAKVIPGQWNDKENRILSFSENASLVIVTTEDNHKAIEGILEDLRQTPK